jgi:hypothetical protein
MLFSVMAETRIATDGRLILGRFLDDGETLAPGARWLGFTDRVMGGVSKATFARERVAQRPALRMKGNVTRDHGGGFAQVALDFTSRGPGLDASTFQGVELLVHGNDEDYNVHIRTPDCGWYDQSYRTTFRAAPEWNTLRLPWSRFQPNDLAAPLDTRRVQRIAVLGWMREFAADLALAEISLYRDA